MGEDQTSGDDKAEATAARAPGGRALIVLVFLILALVIAGLAWWVLQMRDAPPDDLWEVGTHEIDPDCVPGSAACPVLISPRPIGHGSAGEDDMVLTAVRYPELDDPIAQWGACMDTVLTCLAPTADSTPDDKSAALRSCVAAADCPQACRDRFADRADQAGADLARLMAEFDAIFVAEEAWCAPVQ
ncbi:hypothetical protein AWH62_05430 [Maricaulis sp. W15]|uniref:Uncharacterized protein n=1 Tax=Maricaulis maris TaxID=74318 RepID=A0A495D5W2_9PROT|nr:MULTISPECIES: hypothetical protein [Maricaulis]OLF75266.1 hypothetical protein AWH62_05430 [Maricaulis sp. W15]RKQ96548.1 hypothetical protein C7435_1879 [Maricaulis maris]